MVTRTLSNKKPPADKAKDLLSISDRDTWAYGEALREMAVEKKFTYISFSRMRDILDFPLPEKMREITYVANCTNFRRLLLNKYERLDIDIEKEIMDNPDTKLTYLGYRKFLESDLKHIFAVGENRGRNQYKRDVKYLAKQMLLRGYVCPLICLRKKETSQASNADHISRRSLEQ
jgi:pyoverdine/dityrosine biosynthesis protein Dit1